MANINDIGRVNVILKVVIYLNIEIHHVNYGAINV